MMSRPAQLPEHLGMYLDSLRARCPTIEDVWLIGPRANEPGAADGQWDLLAFGDEAALQGVRAEPEWHRDDVNLFLVVDGDRFEKVWGSPQQGRLTELQWRLEDSRSATYVDRLAPSSARTARAVRLR